VKNGRDGANTDIESIEKYFSEEGYNLTIKRFRDIDFKAKNYSNQYILYQSTEDRGLRYKDYIEDILLGLKLQGAILIPDFRYFRAHHNKVFMEILRDLSENENIKNMSAKGFGSYEDLKGAPGNRFTNVVIKTASAAAGRGVRLIRTKRDIKKCAKKISRSMNFVEAVKDVVKSFIWKGYIPQSQYRKKFIVQNFITDLPCDYRVQVYGDKYYVLLRSTRKKNFRASGSGHYEWIKDLPSGLLDFADSVFRCFPTPYISLDIGYDGKDYYLFEFQFVSFGSMTLDHSDCYFMRDKDRWIMHEGKSSLERELVRSVIKYIEEKKYLSYTNSVR